MKRLLILLAFFGIDVESQAQVQTYLTWDSPLGNYIQINSNQGIQRNAGNTFGYDQGDVESVQSIASGESVTFQIGAPGSQFYIGLVSSKPKGQIVADNNENGTWVGSDATVKFGQVFGVFGNDSTSAFEDGTTVGTKYRASINQWFRINYTGSSIQYQYSTDNAATFNTFYTSANVASGSYYIYFSAFILNVSLNSIYKTGAGGGNAPPTVSATATNGTVTSPVTTNTLTASANDPDGTISTYSWVKLSGPSGGSITSPASASTGITGLTNAGVYSYRVTVTDNGGATATADVSFSVTGASQSLVNAGPDQALPLGTTTATLSGSAVVASSNDLIIFFGESNASGQAPNTSATSIERLARPSVKIYNNFNATIENLDLDQNNNLDVCGIPSTHGMEIGLADAVEAGRLNNPTYLLKIACAGTRIDQWLNGTGNPSWNEFVRKTDDMLAKMSAQGVVSPNITLWISIGLNDALQGTVADSFQARIGRFTAAVRSKYGSGIRMYMTQFHRYRPDFGETAPTGNGHPYTAVIDAIDAADPLLWAIETTGATWEGYGVGGDPVHWDYAGFKVIADRMVTATINNRPGGSASWSKQSGPAGGTITSPSQLVTGVTGLQTGTYVYRLTVGSTFDEITLAVGQSTSNINTSIIPLSDPEIMRHLGGAEDWFGQNTVGLPTNATKQLPRSSYKRFNWYELETAQGVFNWPEFDNFFINAINNGQTVSWGVMTMNENTGSGRPFVGGAWLNYPVYLHNLMQAETVNSRDWTYTSNGTSFWVPNWNSPNFLARTKALYDSLYNRMHTRSHNGVLYKNIVDVVEVRHYGQWGEWHAVNYASSPSAYPTGRQPTVPTLDSIISYIVRGNPDLKTTVIISAFDAYYLGNVWNDPAVARFALTIQNSAGFVGWRKDHMGDAPGNVYDYDYTNLNNRGYNAPTVNNQQSGGSFVPFGIDTATMNRWRLAPITGEPPGYTTADTRGDMANLPAEVRFWRHVSFGNGNMSRSYGLPQQYGFAEDSVRLASKIAGHRLQIEGGSVTQTLITGSPFTLTLNWRNAGLTPTYDKYNVMISLRNSGGTTVWSDTSDFQPYLFLPDNNPTAITDVFTLTTIPIGTYNLFVRIVDQKGYRIPLPLANVGRTADGSYQLASGIQVTTGGANVAPVVTVTGTTSVTLPTNTGSLTAAATDADGTIATYLWTQLSGPNTAGMGSPAAATTTITGLIAGTYVFQVLVTDNGGLTATASRTVTVAPAPAANVPPTVNAGNDQTIQAPVSTATLTGTAADSDGSIASYLWTKISGPAGGAIQSPGTISTLLTGLLPGTYLYRLQVTDNSGAISQDDVQVTVLAESNNPQLDDPVANAGTDSTVTQPRNSVTLIGTLDGGAAASYRWEKVSGPRSSRILNPSAPTTKVDLLLAGTYKFRFNAIGSSGAIASDEVNVTVLPPPVGGRYYVTNVSKRLVGTQLQAIIKYEDNTLQVVTANGNASPVSSVRQALRTVDGAPRLVGIVFFADGTSQVYSYK